jgi:predicted acetyltransferase
MSYLTGEQADCLLRGTSTDWLGPASENFDGYVVEHYLGTLVVRHELTEALAKAGGHIGYHVVAPWRRQGHATRMLSLALVECRTLGLERVLLTCDPGNEPSKRVIVANGGKAAGQLGGEDHFWISVTDPRTIAD